MRRCHKIFARDAQSLSLVRELGVRQECGEETADLAFRLPFKCPLRDQRKTVLFGLNVSGLLYENAVARRLPHVFKADYTSLVHGLIRSLIRRRDTSIVLVPHVVRAPGWFDDLRFSRMLAREYKLRVAPEFSSPIEAKSFISGLDILAGSRMHATVAALSSGVPVVPLAYSSKFKGVFESVSYPLMHELASDDAECVIAGVHNAIDRLPELRAAAEKSNSSAQSTLDHYQDHLIEMMRNL
jgi:colanic acid/amylovoran biosynthesis protein